MALNQMIAQGAQFNMPDPVAQYAKMQQLQAVQNQNALAQYQLGSAQRGDVQKNALNQAYSQGVDPATGQLDYKKVSAALAAAGAGSQIPAALKQQFETQKAEAKLSKTTNEVRGQQQKEIDAIARNLSQNPDDESILASKDIIQKSSFYSPEAKAKALAVFDRALSIPVTERGSYFGMQGATAGERMTAATAAAGQNVTANRPVVVGGSLMSPTGQTLANAPEPGFTLSPGQVRYPKGYAGEGGVVSGPTAAAAKPPEKLEIMRALGYSMDAAGDAAYEAAKRAPPTVAAPPVAIGEMRSLGIPETPEGFAYYNELKTKTPVAAPPSMVAEYTFAKTPEGGNFKGTYQQFVTARAAAGRAPAAPRPEPAPRTQQITLEDGSLGIVNMDTGVITRSTVGGAPVKGKPSATAEKTAIQRKQLGLDLDRAIIELTNVTKDGGLIDQSTGSGAGRLIDLAVGFGGKATPGAIAIGELQPIADMALKMVPRFEGPQSNADTTSYKQAAGQLADPTLPREIRKKAGKTVLRLMKDRKGQFASTAMEAEGVAPSPAGATSIRDQADAILRGGN